jgi:hypothetical protein
MPEKFVVSGAMVGFKTGMQSSVDTMLAAGANAGAQHGCFYLTKDSHRLYVGNEDTSLSAVNEGIETLTWSELETLASGLDTAAKKKAATGRFYYASDRNILCVYNGTQFVQLNENTNTYIDQHTISVSESSGTATVSDSLVDNNGGHKDASFTVTGANGITVTGSGTALTLTGDTYELGIDDVTTSGTGAKITLASANTNNDSDITLTAGTNVTITKRTSEDDILIAAVDTKNDSVAVTALGSSTTPSGNGFRVAVTDTAGATKAGTVDPTISWYLGSGSSASTDSAHFTDGNATLDVYSRAAVDSKLQAINAMTYRGTVGSSGSAAASITYSGGTASVVDSNDQPVAVSIGDTFLMQSDGSYNGISYKAGSLLIARSTDGTEQSDGTIAANKLAFDVVAEQWNSDTIATLEPVSGGVQLGQSTGQARGKLLFAEGDNYIGIAEATTGEAPNQTKTITLTHEDVTRSDTYLAKTSGSPVAQPSAAVTQDNEASIVVPIVTSVTSDSKGHVTAVKTAEYTIKDTNASLTAMSASTAVANNVGTVTVGATLTHSAGSTDTPSTSFTVESTSLSITDVNGVPDGIAINMVWGSF